MPAAGWADSGRNQEMARGWFRVQKSLFNLPTLSKFENDFKIKPNSNFECC
jgi:hypothetical protein